ncbi:MAG: site-specific integrase [Dehalococcoidia bacterium]|nr:site-specific integrase [Dehalococcoidia bacterium]
MILEEVARSPELQARARRAPLGPHIDHILTTIEGIGYTFASLQDLVYGLIQFGTYLHDQGLVDLGQLRFRHVESFVATQRRCRGKYQYPVSEGVRGSRYLWRYVCAAGIAAPEQAALAPVCSPLIEEWLGFLERHRGLAPETLNRHRGHISRFLEYLGPDATEAGLRHLEVYRVREYLRRACEGRSRSGRKWIFCSLRIFLRFAWSQGYLARDPSLFVERVPSFKHERLPRGPRWEDARRLLDAPDRATALGRRDYAILQLLLTYGVRAGQICLLSLEHISWRSGTLAFPPLKGGRPIVVPLVPSVGEAILAYLQSGRPRIGSRCVFLSTRPPFPPITRVLITSMVARAFERTGVPSPHHGSHALRHAWATHMLQEGRPLKTIADLLGHRNLETTRIYTKVDLGRLRTVPLPWPEEMLP